MYSLNSRKHVGHLNCRKKVIKNKRYQITNERTKTELIKDNELLYKFRYKLTTKNFYAVK